MRFVGKVRRKAGTVDCGLKKNEGIKTRTEITKDSDKDECACMMAQLSVHAGAGEDLIQPLRWRFMWAWSAW